MGSPLIDIPDAVARIIAAASLSRPATVVREYSKEVKLADLGASAALDVRVYPGPMQGHGIDRRRVQRLVTVKIGFRKKLSAETNADIDPWMEYVEEVLELLRLPLNNPLPTQTPATWHSENLVAPYLPEHLREFHQFSSVLEVTYVTVRG